MKRIYVRKVFPYNPTFNGRFSKYEGYHLIGLQERVVGINSTINVSLSEKISNPIYYSPLRRAEETALFLKNALGLQIEQVEFIKEIKFSLKNLLTDDEYNLYGSKLVRERFAKSFIKDELTEKRSDIRERINKLIEFLRILPEGKYLLISHSFFMKVLQSYIKEKNLFENPQILNKHFNFNKKTFKNGKGFEFNVE